MKTLSDIAERRISEKIASSVEDEGLAYRIGALMEMGAGLYREHFAKEAASPQQAVQAAQAGSSLAKRLVRPAAAAAAVGGAGAVGYGAGHGAGEEEGAKQERMRNLMRELFGIEIIEGDNE